ncbi:hypothetical protein EW093_01355 [Thiospirochaeta perfilievii]|uniref:Outer membrane protein beta-barrel domain-containing protein n=1 Tax=Thiospirochaeta perfilievii TaxID=252967 RepID=A0A5C1Q5R6_9SPIO|nr:hypothetical protein [Thiospirochaeta perfilievii]QEN03403.1 hypothetical protein EW093_01355 [Thiospirochaeta perfilievii]
MKISKSFLVLVYFLLLSTMVFSNDLVQIDSVDVAASNYFPFGTYSKYKLTGVGVEGQVNFQVEPIKPVWLFGTFGYSYGITKTERVTNFNDIKILIGGSYTFNIIDKLTISPQLGVGIMLHIIDQMGVYVDQLTSIEAKLNYELTDKIGLVFTPSFLFFPENNHLGMELGYTIGSRIRL